MNEVTKRMLENIYLSFTFKLAENDNIDPTFYLIKGRNIQPIVMTEEIETRDYITLAIQSAIKNQSDALILVSIQNMVYGPREDYQDVLSGKMKVSDHPNKKECLMLDYINRTGLIETLFAEIKTDIYGTRYVTDQKWSKRTNDKIPQWSI